LSPFFTLIGCPLEMLKDFSLIDESFGSIST